MEGIQFFLVISQIVIAIALIILVLIQKSDGDSLSGLSYNAGGINSAISGKASMSILNKVTMGLIALFMMNCLLLASITKNKSKQLSEELKKITEEQNNKKDSKKPSKENSLNKEMPSNKVQTKPSLPTIE